MPLQSERSDRVSGRYGNVRGTIVIIQLSGAAPKWLREGRRPDYRFSLANERTFLAWIRTALALIAGAIGIDQFATHLGGPMMRDVLVLGLLVAGAALGASAYRRWAATERAMRTDGDIPPPRLFPLISLFVVIAVVSLTPALIGAWH
jgi:putative membrane protein